MGYLWWGRRDLNPGSPAPQAGILDQTRRRPLETGLRPCSSIEGKIVKTLIKLKRSGLSEGTLRTVSNNLKHLAKHCNLDSVESVDTKGVRLTVEFRSNEVQFHKEFIKLMEDYSMIHCGDLSKDEKLVIDSDILYSRLFGKGT